MDNCVDTRREVSRGNVASQRMHTYITSELMVCAFRGRSLSKRQELYEVYPRDLKIQERILCRAYYSLR